MANNNLNFLKTLRGIILREVASCNTEARVEIKESRAIADRYRLLWNKDAAVVFTAMDSDKSRVEMSSRRYTLRTRRITDGCNQLNLPW